MSQTTTKVRIGMTSTRELELDMPEEADVARVFEKALAEGLPIVWLTDSRGHRHGVVTDKVAFIELEEPRKREIGFG